jgi:acyl-homoserine-lactone acylase
VRPTTSRLARTLFASGTALMMLAAAPGVGSAAGLLSPADGTYRASITRTAYGIPHIVADDFGSLGFGQGYGASEDIACSIAEIIITGRGQRSKHFGAAERYTDQVTLHATNLQVDTVFGDINNQGTVEALVNSEDPGVAPSDEIKAMIAGYIAGYNTYLDDVGGADGITDPACKGGDWVVPAVPMDLFRGIYAANLLASAGVFISEIADAAPPAEKGDTGLPLGVSAGQTSATDAPFGALPELMPSSEQLMAGFGKDANAPFGSNGTALGGDVTSTGRGMVLGNPHFPWQGRYRFTQAQLTIPGVYDVAGAMLHGSPVVNIGFNDDIAWTHTVSTAYRFTPYEYRLIDGGTRYLTTDGPQELDRREVEVELADGSFETTDLYATPEGYVVDAPALLLGWTPVSVWAIRDSNAEHLKTLDAFHEMAKATTVQELNDAQMDTMGIPWVNTMAADRNGDALYADNSVVPHVTNAMAQQCMTPIGRALFELAGLPGLDGTRASGDCAWGSDVDTGSPRAGIFGEQNLPQLFTRDWAINANDSYWLPNPSSPLTGFSRIIGCEECERTVRTRMVYRYVMDRLDGSDGLGGANEFTLEQLMKIQTLNRVYAAELTREGGDLDTVCAASAAPAEACDALAAWDGRTDVDSRGAHLFREFYTTSGAATYEVAFDVNDPVNTPRDLDESSQDVIDAMTSGIAEITAAGIAYDAPLGSIQKAGDEGAGDIAVQGGFASTGNANVISISNPTANEDARYRVSYGSSHIQAVAFTDEGVDACTILTYGQAYDPTSAHHDDQTELWANEEWVCWPRGEDAIAAEVLSVSLVSSNVAASAPQPGADDDANLAATGGGTLLALLGLAMVAAATLLRRRQAA